MVYTAAAAPATTAICKNCRSAGTFSSAGTLAAASADARAAAGSLPASLMARAVSEEKLYAAPILPEGAVSVGREHEGKSA